MTVPDPGDLANIGADGRQLRLFIGVIACFFTFGQALLLTAFDMPLPLRVSVFVPAWITALCLLQVRGST